MQRRKHYFMTCAALFFLGLIVLKPRDTFYPAKRAESVCKMYEGKAADCEKHFKEYRINIPIVQNHVE